MKFTYGVIGAGRQGTAALYDLCKNGSAAGVLIADLNIENATRSANRVNELLKSSLAQPVALDVQNEAAVQEFLKGKDVVISAVPYYNNLGLARAAIHAGTSMCDLGGNTEIVFQELELDASAKSAGVTLVPDCGMVPGLGTSVCVYAMSLVDEPEEVYLWDGGLPQAPTEPWNYILTFHFEGLVNEYFGTTEFLRNGQIIHMPCFQEYEIVSFAPPIGELEAFTTAGGTSTAPRTFLGKLNVYQNKTLRYRGHFAQWKAFHDAGLLSEEPVAIQGNTIRPRDLLESVLNPKICAKPGEKDVCIIRALCRGRKNGKRMNALVDLFDYYDDTTGFTAMERTTGWHASIVGAMIARGEVPAGAIPVELAVSGERMMEECRLRGMTIHQSIETDESK
jgi:lysine 6-dehydrogenase